MITLSVPHTDSLKTECLWQLNAGKVMKNQTGADTGIIIIIIHEFHRDASLEQNFRAAGNGGWRVNIVKNETS